MTREEFISKIENPDDVERVMARVDEGAELLQYNIIGNIEKWYDDCAKFYDASVFEVDEETQAFPSEIGIFGLSKGDKFFSFPHFNSMLSEAFDKFRFLKYFMTIEVNLRLDAKHAKKSIKKHVDDHVRESGGQFSGKDFVSDVVDSLYEHYEKYNQVLKSRIDDLKDAIAVIELKEYLQSTPSKTTTPHRTKEISFTPFAENLPKIKIRGERANKLMSDVLVPYFIDRFSGKYFSGKDLESLRSELKMCKDLNSRILNKAVFELYKVFDKHGYVEYGLSQDTYHLGAKDGQYGRVTFDISVWIFDLFAPISDDKRFKDAEYMDRKEKADKIRYIMESDTRSLEMDIPKDWKLYVF